MQQGRQGVVKSKGMTKTLVDKHIGLPEDLRWFSRLESEQNNVHKNESFLNTSPYSMHPKAK